MGKRVTGGRTKLCSGHEGGSTGDRTAKLGQKRIMARKSKWSQDESSNHRKRMRYLLKYSDFLDDKQQANLTEDKYRYTADRSYST